MVTATTSISDIAIIRSLITAGFMYNRISLSRSDQRWKTTRALCKYAENF